MTSLPIHLIDNQTLIAALLRIQSETQRPKQKPKVTEDTEYNYVFRSISAFSMGMGPSTPSIADHHELGMAIAAELWSRDVLSLTLPDVESVMREAERLVGGVE